MDPKLVILFTGKRKSGKDYVAERVKQLLPGEISVIRISGPLKEEYAKIHKLDYNKLCDSSSYKEQYRQDMIKWGEEVRAKDPAYFCRKAVQEAGTKPVWLVSDCRRLSDMKYFSTLYSCLSVRVTASDEVRRGRGWTFVAGVDDAESECALDCYDHDITLCNNDTLDLDQLKQRISMQLKHF